MLDEDQIFKKALSRLTERAKELNCIYQVNEILKDSDQPLERVFNRLFQVIPQAWQHPLVCEVQITYLGKKYQTEGFKETEWMQSADITVDNHLMGKIEIVYTQLIWLHNNSQFLPEEQRLLNSIANHLSDYLFNKKLKKSLELLEKQDMGVDMGEEQDMILASDDDEHWKWRLRMASLIASKLDPKRFGAKAFYIIGSVKNATAGPGSDIDIMIHFAGTPEQGCMLRSWMEGWSYCLSEINYARTGYPSEGLIDLHLVTDQDIARKNSFALKINAVTDPAKELKMKGTSMKSNEP